ncbi:MAG: hypothetical protein HOV81_32975 [Kofleriaceae bacterium]|nr:hypothetical protein [Kofleriaceae bacterium]
MRAVLAFLVVAAAAGCGDGVRGNISIQAPDAWTPAMGELVGLTPYSGLSLGDTGDFKIAVVDDPEIPLEGYRIEAGGADAWTVHAHDVLGAQYGVAAALENLGFRFRHPFDIYAPKAPTAGTVDDAVHKPDVRVRGFQFHTLHPIETYFAFWEPSAGSTNDAHRIIDWVIKNRGNYIQWVALDNIMDPDEHAAWKPFTQELIDYAHKRGVRVGINIQLFGNSNLQNAFDLYDDEEIPLADSIAARLPLITADLPFDVYDLSFGEFFNSEPQVFIDSVNEVARQLRIAAPNAEMHAVVHVGATQRVNYMGKDLLYYFLVQYADPTIVPDIHTVMYYNLYDDAGGAYQHDDFSEHRQYLLDRICAGEKAAYQPETSYWVAFDDSVPMFLPLYVYSRWRDLDGIRQDGCGNALDNHLLFTTGWEWGYWLHDVTALRASYELPAAPLDLIKDAYAPDLGDGASEVVEDLIEEQKRGLMDERLAGYLAGRDLAIDAGRAIDPPIISQPDRTTFDRLVANPDVAAFTADVLDPLRAHADRIDEIAKKLDGLDLANSRWSRELADGIALDQLRTRFVIATYESVIAHIGGNAGDATAAYDRAASLMATARTRVASRHRDLHDTHRRRLVDKTTNKTFYQYGYLYMADTLCYWDRELDQVGAILGNTTTAPPGCLF